MSTNPNESPAPETSLDEQLTADARDEKSVVPPVPVAPPQLANASYGFAPVPADSSEQSQQQDASQPAYGAPAEQTPYYSDQPYQGAQQAYGQQPQQYQQPYPNYGQQQLDPVGVKHSSNSLIMGIISTCAALVLGWIPFIGLLGVAGGIGLGIPAIIQAKRAERAGVKQTSGQVLGWIGVASSSLFLLVHILLFLVIAAAESSGTYSSM